MILIADSGGTSTTWAWPGKRFGTAGMNPMATPKREMRGIIAQVRDKMDDQPSEVFFYGAGCGNDMGHTLLMSLLQEAFPHAKIQVETDLLCACRSTCGNNAGRVGILGTGSNICYYDGKIAQFPHLSLGYILGDEGSGCDLGKQLLADLFRGTMPDDVRDLFQGTYNVSYDQVLHCVYHQPDANRYLAHFANFVTDNMEVDYCRTLFMNAFHSFYQNQVLAVGHSELPLHLVGGVANGMRPLIEEYCLRHHIPLGITQRDPIKGLSDYHHLT